MRTSEPVTSSWWFVSHSHAHAHALTHACTHARTQSTSQSLAGDDDDELISRIVQTKTSRPKGTASPVQPKCVLANKVSNEILIEPHSQSIQESIAALKNLIGHLEETGNDLIKLSGPGEPADSVQAKLESCRERYDKLQWQTEERGIKIGLTLQQEEQVQNKLDELLNALEKRKEDFNNLEPISVRPEKIAEQIDAQKVMRWAALYSDTAEIRLL